MTIGLHLFITTTVACLATAVQAAAQPTAAAPTPDDPSRGWTLAAGYEVFALRDVSRNIRPVDASPIKWEGRGPAVVVRRARGTRRVSHLFEGGYARAVDFTYKAPTRATAGLPGDSASHLTGSYEYRRYLWNDVAVNGLDLGAGGRALASRVAMRRQITAALEQTRSLAGAGVAAVLVARLHRWPRLHLYGSWANGAVVSRRTSEHSADALSRVTTSGGNWLTEWIVGADVRLSHAVRLELEWRDSYEGYSSRHFAYAGDRQALLVGVRYVH